MRLSRQGAGAAMILFGLSLHAAAQDEMNKSDAVTDRCMTLSVAQVKKNFSAEPSSTKVEQVKEDADSRDVYVEIERLGVKETHLYRCKMMMGGFTMLTDRGIQR